MVISIIANKYTVLADWYTAFYA